MSIERTLPELAALHHFLDAAAAEEELDDRLVSPHGLAHRPVAIRRARAHAAIVRTTLKNTRIHMPLLLKACSSKANSSKVSVP